MFADAADATCLAVTADDVGLHRGMTEGAIKAHRHGIVTACSLAACGTELAHAREHLAEWPALDVGVHLMLVGGAPVSPPRSVRSLVTADGVFPSGYPEFVARYLSGRVRVDDIETECRAQIERLLALGFEPVHINSHQHLHALPAIFDVCVRLAAEYRIPYVRIPDDGAGGRPRLGRRMAVRALSVFGRRARDRARRASLHTNDRTAGIGDAGHLDREAILQLLPVSPGLTELVAHPGIGNDALAKTYGWRYAWDEETAALCDPVVRAALIERGIALIGIRSAGRCSQTDRQSSSRDQSVRARRAGSD